MHDLKNENTNTQQLNDVKNFFIVLVLISLLFITVHLSLILRNEEEQVALLNYSSFIRLAASGFWILRYSPVVAMVCAQMRSESGITPYSPQHISRT